MEPASQFDLRQELERISTDFRAKAPPEVVEVMRKATEELLASGIVNRVLPVGATAPDFTLPDAVGRPYRLADAAARGPVVVTFYRGAW
jgi:AhpC/TSA family protein